MSWLYAVVAWLFVSRSSDAVTGKGTGTGTDTGTGKGTDTIAGTGTGTVKLRRVKE